MSHKVHWGYEGSELPPSQWGEVYPIANTGERQSPIDINCETTEHKHFHGIEFEYSDDDITSIENNGHTVVFHATKGTSFISGGPLTGKYKLAQFHFHWGHEGENGSEHTLDGRHAPAEMHLVHWNCTKYESLTESLEHPDGLCVLGVWLEVEDHNKHYTPLCDAIKTVEEKGKKDLPEGLHIHVKKLLPHHKHSYFYYCGSLTTPPLKECVQWIVFSHPNHISQEQLEYFQHVHEEGVASHCIHDNFRPTKPLNGRTVYKSKH